MPAPSPTKGLDGVVRRLLMRRATVSACEQIAERFHVITLEGPALQGVAWVAGQKIQIAMASSFVTRTYTPIDWDASAGRTRILCYAHGDGPGSAWVRDARPGDECDFFGPRSSLDLRPITKPLAIFGDETSIGLALALLGQAPAPSAACHFEFDDADLGRGVLRRFNLSSASVHARSPDEAHVEAMVKAAKSPAVRGAVFVLTGKAGTVQRLRQALKQLEVPTPDVHTKAYWAPGKVGLD